MVMPHEDVVVKFAKGNTSELTGSRIFSDGDNLFSFGTHFPLLVRMPHWGKDAFLLNGDRRSNSTSKHQNYCFPYATIVLPFTILNNIITLSYRTEDCSVPMYENESGVMCYHYKDATRLIGYNNLISENLSDLILVDKSNERWDVLGYRLGSKVISTKEYKLLSNQLSNLELEQYTQVKERRPEACLLEYRKKKYLSAMDDNQYYMVELPVQCDSVEEAFGCLKPEQCKTKFEVKGKSDYTYSYESLNNMAARYAYIRQGEWFFVDITNLIDFKIHSRKKTYQMMKVNEPLPRKNPDSNPHKALRFGHVFDFCFTDCNDEFLIHSLSADTPVVSGYVDHPDHGRTTLSTLEYIRFFACFENTAIQSWSVSGAGVD